jgi:nucleotide-binding universal stress UspA family protein
MKLLIGYDGSDCARAALEDLVLAGLPPDADVCVLSVADMLVPVPFDEPVRARKPPPSRIVRTARALSADVMAQAQQASLEAVAVLTSLFPGWRVQPEVVADSPPWALVKRAQQRGADLIVVGSHGQGALSRLVLGSVSQGVLHHATCSVRIARTRERLSAAPPRIIVGMDGSPHARDAVDELARRPWPDGTEVRVVTAIDPHWRMAVAGAWAAPLAADAPGDVASDAQARATTAVRQLADRGLSATPVVALADPKRLLVEQARTWAADCVFLGAAGHGAIERVLLGSVSAAVAARAPCSVEVVRLPNPHA